MPCCAIITCKLKSQTSSIKQGGISFHRFPKEPDIRSQWIDITGRENWIPTKTSTICSKHFRENDFLIKKSGNRFLKLGAIPRVDIVNIYSNSFSNETPSGSSFEKIVKLNDSGATDCKKKCLGILESNESPSGSSTEKIARKQKLSDTGAMHCKKKCLGITNLHVNPPTEATLSNSFCSTPRKNRSTRKQNIQETPTSNASTPRKRKLQNIIRTKESVIKRQKLQIKREQARNRRLKKKINKIEEVLNCVQDKFALKNEDMSILRNINVQVYELANRMVAENSRGKQKQKYSPAIRSFALTLHYYSPKAYEYVRKTFNTCLPASRTLREWYKTIGGDPGFTTESLEALKIKARSTNYPIVAGLSIDEMAIRRRIEWDGKKLVGQVDIGSEIEGDHVTEAKEALVFLVTGVNSNFKVPVGYFLVDGITGSQRADLILQCLELVEETGIKIISVTFDGCAANIAMTKCLNCSIEDRKVTFEHPTSKEPVLVMLDPSHMIKLLRNAFQCYDTFIDPEGKEIRWEYLMQLNKIQQEENFHLANKLRYHHVHFQNKKMKVRLATQLFSLSVAEAIDFCRDDLNLPAFKDSKATCRFLKIINNMFDIFNSRNMFQYNFKKALTETNAADIISFLDEAVKYMSELKSKDGNLLIKSPRKTGFIGYIGCAEAVKHLFKYLIRTQVLVFMPMYRISQDHLEMLFGNIRSHGGGNNNPTARQFKAAYKKLLVHIELKALNTGNCTALEHISILSYASSPIERINRTTSRNLVEDNEQITMNASDDEEINSFFQNISEFSQQIISYIAGYIAHALLNKIKCDTCVGALLSKELNTHHKFIVAKDKGGLLYPSKDLIHICQVSESVIKLYTSNLRAINKNMLTTKILHQFIGTELFSSISYHQIGEYPLSNHITDLIKAIIEKYISVRLHFILKNSNVKDSKRQYFNKYILFQGQ